MIKQIVFVNKMFSLGYKPLINKPTRITAYTHQLQ